MARTATREFYDRPTIALSLVAGGTLDVGETYHFRVLTANSYYLSSSQRVSRPSSVESLTTDAVNRSIKIDITHSTGNPEYTFVYVAKGTLPPTFDDWNNYSVYQVFAVCEVVTVSMECVANRTKITSYTLTSEDDFQSSPAYRHDIRDHAQDFVTLNGGDENDVWTLPLLYEYALAQGWPTESTIDVISKGRWDDYSGAVIELNSRQLVIASDSYLEAESLLVVSLSAIYNYGWMKIGDFNYQSNEGTRLGCSFMFPAAQNSPGSAISFMGESYVYDTEFRRAGEAMYVSFNIGGDIVEMIDCVVEGGWDRGLGISGSAISALYRNCRSGDNRWETNAFTLTGNETFERFVIQIFGNSGPWFRSWQGAIELTLVELEIRADDDTPRLMYLSGGIGDKYISKINLVNPTTNVSWDQVYWYVPEVGTEAFLKIFRTFDLAVSDRDGDPIVGASVKLEDVFGSEVFSTTTGGDGSITQENVLERKLTPGAKEGTGSGSHLEDPAGTTEVFGPFTLTITADGRQTYVDELEVDEARDLHVSLLPSSDVLVESFEVDLVNEVEVEVK